MKNWLYQWLDSLFPHTKDSETPCPHMKGVLSELSDDTASGPKRWYAVQHVAGCPGCSRTLERLRLLRQRLQGLNREAEPSEKEKVMPLSPERRAAVEAAWAKLDETSPR
ncbi:MAG: hypothetical protein SFU56_11455 [Capsulimonadales bacterium]|nr:hypothetical protein [Capsulimonadales bacterium]